MVQFLIERNANVNAQSSRSGETALVSACRYGDRPTVEVLLANHADPCLPQHAATQCGESAFLTAARWGNSDCLQLLVDHKADPNVTAFSNYLERIGNAAMWGNMYRSEANLRILKEVAVICIMRMVRESVRRPWRRRRACVDSLRFLLEEVKVKDKGGRLRNRLARLEAGDDA